MKEKVLSLIFYFFSFFIAILIFSMGSSVLNSEKDKIKKFNAENNKILNFQLEEDVPLEILNEILKEEQVSIILKKPLEGTGITLESYLKNDGYVYEEDMKKGVEVNKDYFQSKENIGVTTIVLSEELKELTFKYFDRNNNEKILRLENKGIVSDKEKRVIVPIKVFKESFEKLSLVDLNMKIIIAGNEKEIIKATEKIEKYFLDSGKIFDFKVLDYSIKDKSEEGKILKIMSYLVLLVAFINSISLCYLWIDRREKEIIMRKVVGARNLDIIKIFFQELFSIAFVAFITAVAFQGMLSYFTGGYFMMMNIKVKLISVISSFIFTIITVLLITIPFINKIKKFNLVEKIKEE